VGRVLVIGGSNAYNLEKDSFGKVLKVQKVDTPYGLSNPVYTVKHPNGFKYFFISRHGEKDYDTTVPAFLSPEFTALVDWAKKTPPSYFSLSLCLSVSLCLCVSLSTVLLMTMCRRSTIREPAATRSRILVMAM